MKMRGIKRQVVGVVTSDKMDKSVVVQVERLVKHKVYKKYVRKRSRFSAHDEKNICRVGDKVIIMEDKPISKTKRWRVSEVIEKAV